VRHPVVLASTLFSILLALCAGAPALDPSLDVSQYAHTAWKVREGFAKGDIYSIAQTPDGYLWLGTEFGVLRFDGVRAVLWQPPPGQNLPSNQIFRLLASRDGTLWIGTAKGLASWKDGKLTQYPQLAGQYVFRLVEDREGSVWVGTTGVPNGRLCTIQNGSVHCDGADGSLGIGVFGLYEDSRGNLWVGLANGLWRWKPGSAQFYPLPYQANGIRAFGEDDSGALLIGWRGGIARFVDGKTEPYLLTGTVLQFEAEALLRDRDGGLWITSRKGLLHVHQGRTDIFAQPDGLSSDDVLTVFQDREGSIWAATVNGLDRFRDIAIATFSRSQGASNAYVGSVLAARDGSVWVGTLDGLKRWEKGQITPYGTRTAGGAKPDGKLNGHNPNSLFQDKSGRIWVSTIAGFGYLDNNGFVPINGVPGGDVRGIAEATDGNLWIANLQHGLVHLHGTDVQQIPWVALGHKDFATALAADPLKNGLWLGFINGGIAYFKDAEIRESYGAANGLSAGWVSDLRLDPDGALWVATEDGLSRLKDGQVATLTSKNGLPCDALHWIMEDDAHSFWLYMSCGLVRIAPSELDSLASAVEKDKDAKLAIHATVFDSLDGARTRSLPVGYTPHVSRSADGKLWFAVSDGVSVVDPQHLRFNHLPPPVHVEQVIADHKTYEATSDRNGRLELPPLIRDLQIDYTALSFVAPEKVLFRYKLEGWDRDWQDAGTRRQAFYSNLPPRNYRFRVMACNNSGVWNEAGTFLDFSIAPAYYQTWWFRSLCVLAFLALVYGAYRVRVGQLRAQEEKFREAIESIPAMAFVSLPDGYRTFVNKGWVEYTGMTVEQSLGSGWHAAIHPEDLKRVLDEWEAALASGRPMYYEARYRRAEDGQYRWFMVRVVPQRNKRGKIVKWFGTLTDIEDSKRAGEALQRSQFYISEGQRVAHMGSWAFNSAGFDYWSSELFRIHGLDPSGKPPTVEEYLALVHPEDREFMKQGITKMLDDHLAFDFTKRIVQPDGEIRHVRCVGVPVTQGGIFQGFLGTGMDVTEQERLTEELRLSEHYLSEGQRMTHTGSWAWNVRTDERFWSEETFRIFEIDPVKVKPDWPLILDRTHPDDRASLEQRKIMESTRTDWAESKADFRIVVPDGKIKHLHYIAHPVRDASGQIIEVIGTTMDVTEQKRVEDSLRRSESHLAEAQKLTHTGSWAWRLADRKTVHLSEEWYRIYGFDPAEGVPTWDEYFERVHPEDRLKWTGTIERAIVEKADYDQQFRILFPNGKVKWIHTVGHPVLSVAGDLEQFVGSSTDITELKSAEQEREKLRQLESDLAHIDRVSTLGEMAASLAHDIKQPIAAAITSANSCVEWLAHEPPDLDRARAAAGRIDKYGNRAAEIIDRIRSFYKKSPPQRELVDVNGIIEEILTLLKCEADRCSVAMCTELAAELPTIMADRVQLQQVFMNLMFNAIEAMREEGGELTVKSQLQDGQLQFSVSDTGVGLPKEKMDQIFSAFFSTKPQGSGMGLAISRSIVESHGGRLWAAANGGRGATFYFTLPTAAEILQVPATGT
jgi:PAS domain S-box-containing protein